jgi:hypothetical protein
MREHGEGPTKAVKSVGNELVRAIWMDCSVVIIK